MAPKETYTSIESDRCRGSTSPQRTILRVNCLFKVTMVVVSALIACFWFLIFLERDTFNRKPAPTMMDETYYGGNVYTVFTPGCRILDLAPFDYNYLHFFNPEPSSEIIDCDRSRRGELVKASTTHLYVDMDVAPRFTRRPFVCCYKPFRRETEKRNISSDASYIFNIDYITTYLRACFRFKKPTFVQYEFVLVKCRDKKSKRIFYIDYFTFAVDKTKLTKSLNRDSTEETSREEEGLGLSNDKQYSVLILGFDGMSRLNFLRQMPRTASFFEENGGISLLGYNKVGYNTFPNLVPVLTGMSVKDLERECWPSNASILDDCPFIWNLFKKKNYYTAYGEDNVFVSTFSYQKVGFWKQPVDYYLKPFFFETELNLAVTKLQDLTSIVCVGDKPNMVRFENAVRSFVSNMKHRLTFGLFWFNGLSHDYLNYPRLGDKLFRSMLDSLKAEGALNSTVIIALSDHGIRWGPFRKTFQGFLEERLPLATIMLPEGFKNRFPTALENLEINSQRLTTPYDIYETLISILFLEEIAKKGKSVRQWSIYGHSLFSPIGTSRTCPSAGIPTEWCACSIPRNLSWDSNLSRYLAEVVIKNMNTKLKKAPQCSSLELLKLNALWDDAPSTIDVEASYLFRDFIVTFETKPGRGSFEARVRRTLPTNFIVVGVISRLNMYLNDSYCVNDELLKLYCYCSTKKLGNAGDDSAIPLQFRYWPKKFNISLIESKDDDQPLVNEWIGIRPNATGMTTAPTETPFNESKLKIQDLRRRKNNDTPVYLYTYKAASKPNSID